MRELDIHNIFISQLLGILASSLVLLAIFVCPQHAEAKRLYRWIDPDGTVRYSDQIPPDHAGLGRAEMSSTGIVAKEIPRAKTAEEIAQEKATEQEKRRQAMIASSRKEEERTLLRRFQTLEALDRSLSTQVASIEHLAESAQKAVTAIDKHIAELEKRAADMERSLPEPPKELYAQIDQRLNDKKTQTDILLKRQNEISALKTEFADYRKRYIMLLGIVEEIDEADINEQM